MFDAASVVWVPWFLVYFTGMLLPKAATVLVVFVTNIHSAQENEEDTDEQCL